VIGYTNNEGGGAVLLRMPTANPDTEEAPATNDRPSAHADAYCRDFSAAITRVDRRDGRTIVVLDRTAFYPTSGGQPFDIGILVAPPFQGGEGGLERPALQVVDVLDESDGSVSHVLGEDGPPAGVAPAVGQVHGTIGLGPPLRSHAAASPVQRPLGGDRSPVRRADRELSSRQGRVDDRSIQELSRDEIAAAETRPTAWSGKQGVSIRFASADSAARLPLRKESLREGTLRLVEIDGFDLPHAAALTSSGRDRSA
jgi:alanyl-tRNA synthetase